MNKTSFSITIFLFRNVSKYDFNNSLVAMSLSEIYLEYNILNHVSMKLDK